MTPRYAARVEAPLPEQAAPAAPLDGFALLFDTKAAPAAASETAVAPVEEPKNVELPWIDAYLEAPASTPAPTPTPSVSAVVSPTPIQQAAIEEVWPLDDAGKEMTELAEEISAHERQGTAAESSAPAEADAARNDEGQSSDAASHDVAGSPMLAASLPSLPMWNDEEWMDIMPMSPAQLPTETAATESIAAERPWADVAREEAARRGEIESAALALEALAHRVRSGELPIPGYQANLGDAAALAAALAALLGVRR